MGLIWGAAVVSRGFSVSRAIAPHPQAPEQPSGNSPGDPLVDPLGNPLESIPEAPNPRLASFGCVMILQFSKFLT
ncbi:hypothetical protein [Thermoleptolyngbya sp. M55_K2018_002]|uniref:hypothetical protein n=1 Tax=Thermoleptolyngbya sp. M55_K2018_002 TaxID=2747808 RepID=UPI0025E0172F|nr:hypothetical protein [Thermoleptolyngbya sp. M55_K2018_002]